MCRIYKLGLDCIVFDYGRFSPDLSVGLHILSQRVKEEFSIDSVVSYAQIAFYSILNKELELTGFVQSFPLQSFREIPGLTKRVPIVFFSESDPRGDMKRVLESCPLAREEFRRAFLKGSYTVPSIGFRPFFTYLHGLPEDIRIPRLSKPRYKIDSGYVGIGGEQTGIYPGETPGGWNLIGYIDPDFVGQFSVGDRIEFYEDSSEL